MPQTQLKSRTDLERQVYEILQKIEYNKRTVNDFYAGMLAIIFMTTIANFLETYGLDSLVVFYRKPVSTVLDNLELHLEEYRRPLLALEKSTMKAVNSCAGLTLKQCQRFLLEATDSGSNEVMRGNYEDLFGLYKTLVTAVTEARQLPADGVKNVLERLPDNFSAADIYEAYESLINATEHFIKSLRNQGFIDFAAKNLVLNATPVPLIAANVVSFSLGQLLIFSPLVNYFFPHGISQSPMSKIPLELMSQEQLQRYFNQLEKHHLLVSTSAGRYKKFSRALTTLVLSYTAMAYFFELKINYAFLVLILGFFTTGLKDTYSEAKEWNDSRVLTKRLDVQSTQLTEMIPDNTNGVIETNDAERLEASSFTIKFTGSYLDLSPKILKRIVRAALLRFGDNIIAEDQTSITIAAGKYLNKKQADTRQKYIADYIAREKTIYALRKQLIEIEKCLSRLNNHFLQFVPGFDEKHLPIITAHFYAPAGVTLEKLKTAFPALIFTEVEKHSDGAVSFSLRGFQAGDVSQLNQWTNETKKAFAEQDCERELSVVSADASNDDAQVESRKPKRKHESSAAAAVEEVVEVSEKITWNLADGRTVTYDPAKGDNQDVRPIFSNGRHWTGQFGLFAVKEDQFFGRTNAYNSFHGIFSNRLRIVGERSQQGAKFHKHGDGSSALKLKVLGENGDLRIDAHAVHNDARNILHVFDSVRRAH